MQNSCKFATVLTVCSIVLVISNAAPTIAQTQRSNQKQVSASHTDAKKSASSERSTNSKAETKREENVSNDASDWILLTPTDAEAEFRMPKKPRLIERRFTPVKDEPAIKVRLYQASFNNKTAMFKFGYHDQNSAPTSENIEETLDGAVRGSFANVAGKLLEHGKIRYGEHQGRAYKYIFAHEEVVYKVYGRVFMVGKRQYQLNAVIKNENYDEELAEAFLNSFRIVQPDDDLPPEPKKKSNDKSG